MVDVCECLAGAVVEAAGEAGKVVNTCRTRFWTRMADADRAAAAVAADREHLPEDANVAVVVDVALTPAAPGQHLQSPGVKRPLPELRGGSCAAQARFAPCRHSKRTHLRVRDPRYPVLRRHVARSRLSGGSIQLMTKRHHRRLQRGPPRYQQRGLSRAWADLPLRAKGLVVVTIPLATLVTAGLLFSATLAADRQAQGAVLRTVEVERQVAQLRILVQAGVSGYLLTGQQQYLTTYQTATRDLPAALGRLGRLVGDNPRQVDHLRQIRTLTSRRFAILAAMVASVRANSPPSQRLALLDRNKQLADQVTAQLEAMQAEQQRLLTARQAHARQTRTLILDAIGLSLLLGVAGGTAAMLLFASGVTRRASHLEHNADRLASG